MRKANLFFQSIARSKYCYPEPSLTVSVGHSQKHRKPPVFAPWPPYESLACQTCMGSNRAPRDGASGEHSAGETAASEGRCRLVGATWNDSCLRLRASQCTKVHYALGYALSCAVLRYLTCCNITLSAVFVSAGCRSRAEQHIQVRKPM